MVKRAIPKSVERTHDPARARPARVAIVCQRKKSKDLTRWMKDGIHARIVTKIVNSTKPFRVTRLIAYSERVQNTPLMLGRQRGGRAGRRQAGRNIVAGARRSATGRVSWTPGVGGAKVAGQRQGRSCGRNLHGGGRGAWLAEFRGERLKREKRVAVARRLGPRRQERESGSHQKENISKAQRASQVVQHSERPTSR